MRALSNHPGPPVNWGHSGLEELWSAPVSLRTGHSSFASGPFPVLPPLPRPLLVKSCSTSESRLRAADVTVYENFPDFPGRSLPLPLLSFPPYWLQRNLPAMTTAFIIPGYLSNLSSMELCKNQSWATFSLASSPGPCTVITLINTC